MNRTLHTNDVIERVKAEVEKINTDGTLPAGVKIVPIYDRTTLVNVTTSTVLHNLVVGCALIFLLQWIFVGDLRSALIVAINIPFALFFSIIIIVIKGEDANLLSLGAVDFGIVVDSAVILVENIFRVFQASEREVLLRSAARLSNGSGDEKLITEIRLIFVSASQVESAILFSTLIILAAFVPLFTMQGVEGQIFNPMARTYAYALIGALLATFTITPVLASLLLPDHVERDGNFYRSGRAFHLCPGAYRRSEVPAIDGCTWRRISRLEPSYWVKARNRVLAGPGGGKPPGSAPPCRRRFRSKPACRLSTGCGKFSNRIRKSSRSSRSMAAPTTAATPPAFSTLIFRAAQALRGSWASGRQIG